MLIQGLEALGIGNKSKPFGAVDAVVIATSGTDTGIQAKVLEINNKTALWALAPKTIALFGFLFDIADVLTFTAISKPVE
jgi:energy-converting hydrogenase Eha subunit F